MRLPTAAPPERAASSWKRPTHCGSLPPLAWRYANPGLLVAEQLGISPPETALASIGGNGPQSIASRTALAISEGRLDVALDRGCRVPRDEGVGEA